MSSIGRPRLDQKDGYHRHDGYDRLHPVEQHHWGDLHKSNDGDAAVEILTLLEGIERLEKQDIGSEMLLELEKSIHTLLQIKRAKSGNRHENKHKLKDPREEQSVLGDTEGEVREPNTIGLP
ncbi:hypothetical protein CMI37_24970 [Candidatus Pacearchaeota archaeon]|nr:hypothetical protein [Candidatus Pacearchaeota archaeon]